MSTAILVLLVSCVLPVACAMVSGACRHKQFGEVDNKQPRLQNAQLTGMGARAVAAQANAWEALAVYVASLLALQIAGINPEQFATVLWVFLAARLLHLLSYLFDQHIVRSLAFFTSFGSCIYLMVQAL